MTSEICDIPTTWWGVIPGDQRFIGAFADPEGVPGAYCDRQTGLVLESSPSTELFTWFEARFHCANRTVGGSGQMGWRLLSMPELASLVDTNSTTCTGVSGSICLPDGHPFQDVQSDGYYWSASTLAGFPEFVWYVGFHEGDVDAQHNAGHYFAWCGRGPTNTDAY